MILKPALLYYLSNHADLVNKKREDRRFYSIAIIYFYKFATQNLITLIIQKK